jgi:GTPase SAR1 family protein
VVVMRSRIDISGDSASGDQSDGLIRARLIDLYKDIEYTLGPMNRNVPPNCRIALDRLRSPEYDVVVCGEVKRGKSSFVNALIGRELLPTGVREATSQVFRIASSLTEAYAIVFDDGHREAITEADLERYGSQTGTELEGLPLFRGRTLRWIEVRTPGVFLPKGVHLVDTPGLGALYSAHSEITHRYIASADAVIFVLDSGQPLTQSEKRFLEKCLKVTPNILFIQTKIDTKKESEWQAIQERNEKLLNAAFHKEGRPKYRVFPVSSKLLAESAQEQDDEERAYLLEDSLFEAARKGLEVVMFRATGWTRCAWAAAEASRFVETCRRDLEEQYKVLSSESATEKDEIRCKKAEIRAAFQKEWGAAGAKRNEFMTKVSRIMQGVRNSASFIGSQGSDLYNKLQAEINALNTREAIEGFAAALPEKVQSEVAREWHETILSAQKQIAELDKNLPMLPEGHAPFFVNLPQVKVKDPSLWDRVKNTNIDGMVGGSLAAILAGIFLTGGIATAAVVAGAAVGATRGYSRIMAQQLESARNELRQQLVGLLAQSRNALCAPDMRHGNPVAKVDNFIEETQATVKATLEEQYSTFRTRMEEQEQKLEEQAKLKGEQRAEEIKTVRAQLDEMSGFQTRIKELIEELRVLQLKLDAAEAAVPGARV